MTNSVMAKVQFDLHGHLHGVPYGGPGTARNYGQQHPTFEGSLGDARLEHFRRKTPKEKAGEFNFNALDLQGF